MLKGTMCVTAITIIAMCRPAFAEATQAERAACQADAFRLCSHAIPNRDQVRSCLRQNMQRISPLCRGALQRSGR
jgi:hypothetical protein